MKIREREYHKKKRCLKQGRSYSRKIKSKIKIVKWDWIENIPVLYLSPKCL